MTRKAERRAETVKLGISARCARISSVVGIISIIEGGYYGAFRFPAFRRKPWRFSAGLARHNNRDWFQPRKEVFEESVKQPMRELVTALNWGAGGLRAGVRRPIPRRPSSASIATCASARTRSPTRSTSPPASLCAAASAHEHGGLYVRVSHKEVAVGGGVYMPEPAALLAIRSHIAENHRQLRRILANPKVRRLLGELQGEQLARVPKGFCARSSRGRPAALQAVRSVRGTCTRSRDDAPAVPGDRGSLPRHAAVPAVPQCAAAEREEARRAGFVGIAPVLRGMPGRACPAPTAGVRCRDRAPETPSRYPPYGGCAL